MTRLRLLADDLTGALDTAAEFTALTGPLPVVWSPEAVPAGSAVLDSRTRELTPDAAAATVAGMVVQLTGADIAFKKVDSLLRGPTLAEVAACMASGLWRFAVLAPAFPYQGRITRNRRQYRRTGTQWTQVSDDLVTALQALGAAAQPGRPGAELAPGVSVFDAETDDDLRHILATVARHQQQVLWIGSGGLAQAMAADHPQPLEQHQPDWHSRADKVARENNGLDRADCSSQPASGLAPPLPRPILGLFGSDQPATADQLAACDPHWLEITDQAFAAVPSRLRQAGVALVSFRLPAGISRNAAARHIGDCIRGLTARIEPPGTIVVAGGQTLQGLCDCLAVQRLVVQGRLVPGVPVSLIQGGRWHGVAVVSKSGAFGHPHLLRELILPSEV